MRIKWDAHVDGRHTIDTSGEQIWRKLGQCDCMSKLWYVNTNVAWTRYGVSGDYDIQRKFVRKMCTTYSGTPKWTYNFYQRYVNTLIEFLDDLGVVTVSTVGAGWEGRDFDFRYDQFGITFQIGSRLCILGSAQEWNSLLWYRDFPNWRAGNRCSCHCCYIIIGFIVSWFFDFSRLFHLYIVYIHLWHSRG